MKKPPYMPGSTLRRPAKPMARFNPDKRARRESEGRVYGGLHAWTKRQACVLSDHPEHACGFYGDRRVVESHHVRSVGSGGEDENNTLPACPVLHDEFHTLGLTRMCERYGKDFRSLACEVTDQYVRERDSSPESHSVEEGEEG